MRADPPNPWFNKAFYYIVEVGDSSCSPHHHHEGKNSKEFIVDKTHSRNFEGLILYKDNAMQFFLSVFP
jgi:hypothetical protein